MSDETLLKRRYYSRGYSAGSKGAWSDHRPPAPPQPIVAEMMLAARALRDGVDSELAMLEEWNARLGPLVDRVDAAMIAIGEWLRSEGKETP